jgi:hypothetical protein
MLTVAPDKRITAAEALEHEYFKVPPLACLPSELPKLPDDTHEYGVKIRMANAKISGRSHRLVPLSHHPGPSTSSCGLKRPLESQELLLTRHLEPYMRRPLIPE